jgi:hypothetical protein
MSIENKKINLINWISSIQEEDVLNKIEQIQKEKRDWWDTINDEDEKAINEGLTQLDNGECLTRSQVRSKLNKKFNI